VIHYFETISGKQSGFGAAVVRGMLRVCSVPYGVVTRLRNVAFDVGILRSHAVDVPVLSIGNVTTGGTGKTPTVAWLVQTLVGLERYPAIVSRGYGAIQGAENDEKRLLDSLCPAVPHVQNPSRYQAAQAVLQSGKTDVIVLDDGFQHRKLKRDLDIVLIDALNPWGYDALLPRGLLRESLSRLKQAHVILVTRCELATDEQIHGIIERLRHYTSAPVLRTAFLPKRFVNASGQRLTLEQAAERVSYAFCGIGNPEGFRRTLMTLAIGVPESRFLRFPDHHHYSQVELQQIRRRAEIQLSEILLTTRKDLVKIQEDKLGPLPLWALDIELTFLDDPAPLYAMLKSLLPVNQSASPAMTDGELLSSHPDGN